MKLNFLAGLSKNPEISNFMKPRPVGAELLHADRRTDMAKLTVAFRNLANASKMPAALPSFPTHYLVTRLIDPRGTSHSCHGNGIFITITTIALFQSNFLNFYIRSACGRSQSFDTCRSGENKTNSMLHNGLLDLMNRSTCSGH